MQTFIFLQTSETRVGNEVTASESSSEGERDDLRDV